MEHGVLEGTPMRRDASGRQEAVMHDGHMDAKVLRRAAEIVEQGWCQGALSRRADGTTILTGIDGFANVLHPEATQWCMQGAVLLAACEIGMRYEWERLYKAHTKPLWNNAPERTADEVAAALREAADRCDGVSPERPQDVTPAWKSENSSGAAGVPVATLREVLR